MALVIILVLLGISLLFIKRFGLCGVCAFFLFCGSTTDSAGILYGIDGYFPYFKELIWVLSFLLLFYSVFLIFRKCNNQKFLSWYFYPFVGAIILIQISAIVNGQSLALSSTTIVSTGIPYFFIWFIGRNTPGREKVLVYMLLIHAIVSLVIILGEQNLVYINGFTYLYRIDANVENYNIEALINNSLSIFDFNKYTIQKTGQFHNSNALGFFSAILISFGIGLKYKLISTKYLVFKKILPWIVLVLGILLWFNSLTRGPIISLVIIGVFVFSRPWVISKNIHIYFVMFFVLLFSISYFLPSILEYLFPSLDDVSYTSRLVGYQAGFDAILTSPLWGVLPGEYPPHLYTLKIMAYYGVLSGILITVPIIDILLRTIKNFWRDLKQKFIKGSTFNLMLLGTLYGVYFTNGTVSYVLFGIILGEVCIRSGLSLRSSKKLK